MSSPSSARCAAIFGCDGPALTPDERRFFRDADPLGFIVLARNVVDPAQVERLVDEFRLTVGRHAPVLIDQEGGRVQRLRPPHWRQAPPASRIGAVALRDHSAGERAAWLNARLIADELATLGIDVNCAPVLDVPQPDAHAIIGDRAFGSSSALVAALGRQVIDAFIEGGVLPVIKHVPGHGRATLDSHEACPVVTASVEALDADDLAPFRALGDAPFAMTAHVIYGAWDPDHIATLSSRVIGEVIRGRMGFENVLLSDDLGMKALSGSMGDRAQQAQAAGCDVVLHCNGSMAEMDAIAGALALPSAATERRVTAALARRVRPSEIDQDGILRELTDLLTIPAA